MKNNRLWKILITPALLALPFALGMGLAALFYGKTIQNLIHVAIKLMVTR